MSMYNIETQTRIQGEIDILLAFINYGVINNGVAQKVEEQRLSQEIETHVKQLLISSFLSHKRSFTFLSNISENNGSTKSPYELLLLFCIEGKEYDVYVDFKPLNILKKSTAPFMGSINKYINRINDKKYYDVFFIVNYESKVNNLPILKEIKVDFVKDITNYSLYNNWQLQLTIKSAKVEFGRSPDLFKSDLILLLERMKSKTVNDIISKCDNFISKLK